jgi:hypothetical protein
VGEGFVIQRSIFTCRDPRASEWELGPLPPTGRLALIGWRQPVDGVDAGVPTDVAAVLARAWTSAARVTFPSTVVEPPTAGDTGVQETDVVRVLSTRTFGAPVMAKLKRMPSGTTLISTLRHQTAMRLFEDAGFPWWLQGQIALLSQRDAPAPTIDVDTLVALFEEDWTTRAAALVVAKGIEAIVRPGVDGDVAGLWSASNTVEQSIVDALEREARVAGFDWETVPEAALVGR